MGVGVGWVRDRPSHAGWVVASEVGVGCGWAYGIGLVRRGLVGEGDEGEG